MASYFWNSGNGLWQTAGDWSPNGSPGPSNGATVGATGFPTDVTVTSDAGVTVGVPIIDAGSTLDIDPGTTLTRSAAKRSDRDSSFR